MFDEAGPLAIVRYGPDVDILEHRALLATHQMECQMLGADDAASQLRHVPVVYLISAAWWSSQSEWPRQRLLTSFQRASSALLLTGKPGDTIPADLDDGDLTSGWLDCPISTPALRGSLRAALSFIKTRAELFEAKRQLQQRTHEMREVHRVGMALSSERNLEALQELILRTSREMTNADAGTLYLLETNDQQEPVLVFHVSQNDSVHAPYQRLVIPVSTRSMAGYVASTGQSLRLPNVYQMPPGVEYGHNPAFDQRFGYWTRSMLVVPMLNHHGDVTGVIQLMNRKRHFEAVLQGEATVDAEVIPFSEENEQLLASFASQGGVTLENRMLLDSIQKLFAGFIRASVTAIESRDPATSGHSDRVARLTVGLARTINDVQAGRWRLVHFNDEQLKEIEYAGLLHDFGKVGVREHVLVKAKKLYDWKLEQIRSRFRYARKVMEHRATEQKLQLLLQQGYETYVARVGGMDTATYADLEALDEALAVVLAANEPSILEEERFQALMQVATRQVLMPDGMHVPLIEEDELRSLTIRRGTLDEQERLEIQSHVSHSFNFLIQIPWTRELQQVPHIAHAHHEKLNGTGYPRRLQSDEIPIQAKMMTIADIFDALAAQDRPYKPPVPINRALDILNFEARDGLVDADLLDLFIRRDVFRLITDDPVPSS